LIGCAGLALSGPLRSSAWAQEDPGEAKEIGGVQAIATKAGLGKFTIGRNEHFLGLGDTNDRFRAEALDICEGLAKEFLAFFHAKGFKVAYPEQRMTVIILKDDASYRAFTSDNLGLAVGGHFDLETNHLVMFDFRPRQAALAAGANRVNLFTLVHETAHLLSYNTGLLSRKRDVPDCISEGFATFFEMWRPAAQQRAKRRTPVGAINRPRLQALVEAGDFKKSWQPIGSLIQKDELLRPEDTRQVGYAESWLLIHYLLTTPAELPRLKGYLSALPPIAQAGKREQTAEQLLGPFDKLDHALQSHARRQWRR